MKIWMVLFFLSFSKQLYALSVSDLININNLNIEGISLDDSLLTYMSKKDIKNEISDNSEAYEHLTNEFGEIYIRDNLKIFDYVSVFVKQNDKHYKIYSVRGGINLNFNDCTSKKNNLVRELTLMFKETDIYNGRSPYMFDSTGKSFVENDELVFSNGDMITLSCSYFSQEVLSKYNYAPGLSFSLDRKEFYDWMSNYINK